jgi:RHS repeat-associated protein
VYDAADRLLSDPSFTYAYDKEGDLTAKTDRGTGAVTRYVWNMRHQLVQIVFPDGTQSLYRYDPFGHRIETNASGQISRDVYGGADLRLRFDGTNTLVSSFVDGTTDDHLEASTGGQRLFYIPDLDGSTAAITDGSGKVVGNFSYDSFGKPYGSNPTVSGSPFTYAGREFDQKSGLYYFRARYYDPRTGRFVSEDPVFHVNAYAYAANDPINLSDSTGAQPAVEYALLTQKTSADVNNAECIGGVVSTIAGVAAAAIAEALGGGAPTSEATNAAMLSGLKANEAGCVAGSAGGAGGRSVRGAAANTGRVRPPGPYVRPSGTPTRAQRASVQGKPCVTCGALTPKQVADHKYPIVQEWYETGKVDEQNARSLDAVQSQCPTCSARQGGRLRSYARKMRANFGFG